MKKYCLVENNSVIEGPKDLPKNTKTVSNFHLLNDEILKTYGWLPCETISEEKPVFVSSSFEVLEDKVIENIVTRDKTEEEIAADLEGEKQSKWYHVRRKRNELLSESDVHVLSDKWEDMDSETKEEWKTYRKALRDIPQNFDDPDSVEFPKSPLYVEPPVVEEPVVEDSSEENPL